MSSIQGLNLSSNLTVLSKNEMYHFPFLLISFTFHFFFELLKLRSLLMLLVAMFLKRKCLKETKAESKELSLLDLPDLPMDEILNRLPAASLLQMAGVCRELRKRSKSDHLWEILVAQKWGELAGPAAYYKRQFIASRQQDIGFTIDWNPSSLIKPLFSIWPFSSLNWHNVTHWRIKSCHPPLDNLMAWYWALERGSVWFSAQVYNREHGHVGFTLSCYDADVCYDRHTNTFSARYLPHGPRTLVIEEGVPWDRLRAPPVDTPAHSLHFTECLDELQPGDHVEVQWRRNKEFPYGWWYAVVGHNDGCDRSNQLCQCHLDDTICLEFNQYTHWSRWRRAAIVRKSHHEVGNEAEGFYGGIRKLKKKEDILIWAQLWPTEKLE
ncbi:hypothetical protein O6H91_07G067300 [Diphasiastrum complanatum]|uniref:Uncharacterized protein n=1 Tax=Diphasiastrum complanatum TaxID=34168 RepID=A0ACC2D6C0_DIPCM|nr:hypothetical protein O6H91_07G067300 [Diphasiastrum complanatum]